jgi:hypothetical protein
MQLILTALERLVFIKVFPKQDSMINMMLQKGLAEKAQLTAEEINALNLKPLAKGVKGEWHKVADKPVEVTSAELKYLRSSVDKLDKASAITADMLNVCKKIEAMKEVLKPKP